MSRGFSPGVVTANTLLSGEVVYLTADDRWSPNPQDADLIGDEAHAQQRLEFAAGQPDKVVGPYLAEAARGPDGPLPRDRREAIRSRGPSNYPHGKQARAV